MKTLSPAEAWKELIEYGDRACPARDDLAYIRFEELRDFMERGAGDLMAELQDVLEEISAAIQRDGDPAFAHLLIRAKTVIDRAHGNQPDGEP